MSAPKRYPFNPKANQSFGKGIYYECEICGDRLNSASEHAIACKCRNVIIDIDSGRIAVKSPEKVIVLR
jgi:hypothetical protein